MPLLNSKPVAFISTGTMITDLFLSQERVTPIASDFILLQASSSDYDGINSARDANSNGMNSMKCPRCKEGTSVSVRSISRQLTANTHLLCQEFVISEETYKAYFFGQSVPGACKAEIFRSRVNVICPYCSLEYDWIIGDDVLEKKQ